MLGKVVFVEGGSAFGAVWGCSCVGVRSRDDWLEECLWDARVPCPASRSVERRFPPADPRDVLATTSPLYELYHIFIDL